MAGAQTIDAEGVGEKEIDAVDDMVTLALEEGVAEALGDELLLALDEGVAEALGDGLPLGV